jgi:hypothetical protein
VALLVVLCCAPSVARAGCGDDYVVTRAAHLGGVTPMAQHATDMPAPLPAKPCHGPNCSNGPVVPPLSLPTVTPQAPPEWGSLIVTLAFVPPGAAALFADSSSPHPVSLASSIFHPPRRAA